MTERNRDGRPAKGRRLIIGAACLGLLMLAAVCFVCLDTNTTSADPDSGTCGENLTCEFDGVSTQVLGWKRFMAVFNAHSVQLGTSMYQNSFKAFTSGLRWNSLIASWHAKEVCRWSLLVSAG